MNLGMLLCTSTVMALMTLVGCPSGDGQSEDATQPRDQPDGKTTPVDPYVSATRLAENADAYLQLRGISALVALHREAGRYSELNEFLRTYARRVDAAHSPRALFWIGDNHLLQGQYPEAVLAFEGIAESFGDRRFRGRSWAALALDRIAEAHRAAGDAESSVKALVNLIDRYDNEIDRGWARFRLAQMYERMGEQAHARKLYREIQREHLEARDPETGEQLGVRADRAVQRMESDRSWVRAERSELVRDLRNALGPGAFPGLGPRRESAHPFMFNAVGVGELGSSGTSEWRSAR